MVVCHGGQPDGEWLMMVHPFWSMPNEVADDDDSLTRILASHPQMGCSRWLMVPNGVWWQLLVVNGAMIAMMVPK